MKRDKEGSGKKRATVTQQGNQIRIELFVYAPAKLIGPCRATKLHETHVIDARPHGTPRAYPEKVPRRSVQQRAVLNFGL